MVKMMGLSPVYEEAPVGVSVAGTLGFDDFSGLSIGLPSCVTTTKDLDVVALSVTTAGFFVSTTHLLVSGQGVQCINELHCNALFGRSCFLVHAREVPGSQAKKASVKSKNL